VSWPRFEDRGDEELLLLDKPFEEQLASDWRTLMGEDPKPQEVLRMPKKDLQRFVRDFLAGLIFTSAQVHESDRQVPIFLPLDFGVLQKWDTESRMEVGVIWEYYKEALPRGVNGYPMFMSMRIMHRKDWARAAAAIDRERQRLEEIEV
jgi:hypothetical protein